MAGEYEEDADFDDLLGGDSDESDADDSESSRPGLLAFEDLSLKDGSSTAADKEAYSILDEVLPPDIDMDFDEDEEKKKTDRLNQQKADAAESRKKLQKMLHTVPPGINLFLGVKDPEDMDVIHNGFKYFTFESLSLEKDFDYKRRSKLEEHGFSQERITDMLTDHREFIRHLMPEAQSVLLCDQADFKAIMNFIFYSITVCSDPRMSELLMKSFFDLRKNYGFRWSLSLKQILTCLLNFGADVNTVASQRFYSKFLEKHLDAVRKSGQEAPVSYQLPELPTFIKKRQKELKNQEDPDKFFAKMTPGNFRFCVEKFIILVSDFSAGFLKQPCHLDFRHKNNWCDTIVLLYIFLLLGTDKRLIRNYRVKEALTLAIHFHLDSFSSPQWYWGPEKKEQPKTAEGHKEFNGSNVHKSLVILLNEFFPGEICPEVVNWDPIGEHADKVSFLMNNTSDHHLNMLARLALIPPSFRGNQLRKYLAFMYLQTIAETVYVTPPRVDVFDLVDIPELCDDLAPGLKIIVKSKNFEVMMTVVELYDMIVGHEPTIDFTKEKIDAIQKVQKNVLQWIQKKLPNMNRINIDDQRSIKGMQLSEYLDIVISRWQTHSQWLH